MAPRRAVKTNNFHYKNLSENDVICPICRTILIKPVTLPCNHGFCATCLDASTQNENRSCPICRVRVGSWLRAATKSNKLVNEDFWKAIQDYFPAQVKNKLKGNEIRKGIAEESSDLEQRKGSIRSPKKMAIVSKKPLLDLSKKEYTCRILCQNIGMQKKKITTESLMLKNKRIQKIAEADSDERSNSIESEYLYFKPIDYRRNPPTVGGTPIKVPSRKPDVNNSVGIIAPSGQKQIKLNGSRSAFASLHPVSSEETVEEEIDKPVRMKRKLGKPQNSRKKLKSTRKTPACPRIKSESPPVCAYTNDKNSNNVNKVNNVMKQISKDLQLAMEAKLKKALQEKADYELALKLQETYNQATTYITRSSVPKQVPSKVNIDGIRPRYKVK